MKAIKGNMKAIGLAALMVTLMMGAAAAQDPSDGLVPTVRVQIPNLSPMEAKTLPTTFSVGVWGQDADSDSARPVRYRHLLVSAQYDTLGNGDPLYIRTPLDYQNYGGDLLSWDDPGWSAWEDYPAEGDVPQVEVTGVTDWAYYLLALQVMDSDGAVSVALDYQVEVLNFRARDGAFRPAFTICETYLGCTSTSAPVNQIAGGQPLNFSWIADASYYGGTIVSYRHGWDLIDPDDPNDPGWAVPPGLEPENLFAAERIFQDGLHTFYLRVVDSAGQIRQITWRLEVVPFVSRDNQLELLLIDQVYDDNSQAWQDQSGQPRDNEVYRNAYWQFLAGGSGGVSGFNWERDYRNDADQVEYSDLVIYKAVLSYAKFTTIGQTMYEQLRPVNGQDRFVWLTPYQMRGGNFFQVGQSSMESLLEELNYMVPIIFDAPETVMVVGDVTFTLGFGQKELPDGTLVPRGPELYPYATAGISAIDWTSPSTKTIFGRPQAARFDRKVECVGLKGLVLDDDFQANHSVGVGAIADTFFTDQVIDWQDAVAVQADTLGLFNSSFPFRTDEFVDANLSSRTTPIIPQECAAIPQAPGGMCVEPMFTGISRMDWVRESKWADGDSDWPQSEYTAYELDDGCGTLALTSYQGTDRSSALTNDQVYGYMSYKLIEDKPAQRADVYWGFDPYRFDHDETKKAIQWVLEYFGLQINP